MDFKEKNFLAVFEGFGFLYFYCPLMFGFCSVSVFLVRCLSGRGSGSDYARTGVAPFLNGGGGGKAEDVIFGPDFGDFKGLNMA